MPIQKFGCRIFSKEGFETYFSSLIKELVMKYTQRIKKVASIFCVATIFSLSTASAGGIPTVDPLQIAATQTANAEQISKWVTQLEQMRAQVEQMKGVWNTLKGGRGMASMMHEDLARQYLPEDYWPVADAIRKGSGDWGGISGRVEDIVRSNQFKSCSQLNKDPDLRRQCEIRWRELAMQKDIGDLGYKKASQNIDNLQKYISRINASSDLKELSEVSARIQVEQVRLQNEQIKLDTIAKMELAQKAMESERVQNEFENGLKSFSRPNF